ncbi:MAG TPA: ribokinase [Thermomicrobiales bacterium]|jgi:ribokinase|nr:ribokinase [Thermomicrobiales bacterium]
MRTGRVVVGGAINTDLVATTGRAPGRGETVTGTGFAIYGGGKGANQAVAAARSGADVVIIGGVGDDAFGRDRLAELEADGIATNAVSRVGSHASGVALITVEQDGDNRILYVPGATLAVDADHAIAVLDSQPVAVLLLTLELAPEVIDRLIARARDDGATIILNATPEPEGASRLLGQVDVLVVNETEALALARLDGNRETTPDWEQIGLDLVAQGPGAVVLTLGGAGAMVVTVERVSRIPAIVVDVVDTTGAGDTLCGALAAALARGLSLEDAVRHGVVAGSLACTVAGAQPSIPRLDEIVSRLDQ